MVGAHGSSDLRRVPAGPRSVRARRARRTLRHLRARDRVGRGREPCCPAPPALVALEEVLDRVYEALERGGRSAVTRPSDGAAQRHEAALRAVDARPSPALDEVASELAPEAWAPGERAFSQASPKPYGGRLDVRAAARVLGISEGVVRSRIHRGVLVPDGRGPRGVGLFFPATLEAQLRGRPSSSDISGRATPRDIDDDEVFDGATTTRAEYALSWRAADRGRAVPAPTPAHRHPHGGNVRSTQSPRRSRVACATH